MMNLRAKLQYKTNACDSKENINAMNFQLYNLRRHGRRSDSAILSDETNVLRELLTGSWSPCDSNHQANIFQVYGP